MIIQRYKDTYSGYYDFNVTGGAIGSYNLQVPIPPNFTVEQFYVVCVNPFISGGLATVSFDAILLDIYPNPIAVGMFIPPTAFSSYPNGGSTLYGIFPGGITPQAPIKLAYPFSVGISIGTANITDGQFQIIVEGVGFDF